MTENFDALNIARWSFAGSLGNVLGPILFACSFILVSVGEGHTQCWLWFQRFAY